MIIAVPRHVMIKTILKHYLSAGVIEQDEIEHTRKLLEQYPNDELAATLIEAHMLNPLNLEQHELIYISNN